MIVVWLTWSCRSHWRNLTDRVCIFNFSRTMINPGRGFSEQPIAHEDLVMRIYFKSLKLPKKAAKRIQAHFTPSPRLGEKPKLSDAQELTACMLGYSNWHELEQVTKSAKHPPSPVDEEASPEEQARRIDYQANILSYVSPVTEPILREIAFKVRVSAGNPLSTKFSDDAYRVNAVFYWEPYGEDPEWRFRPSIRSANESDDMYALIDRWSRGQINFGEYKDQLDETIERLPEFLTPYLYLLEACSEIKVLEIITDYLPRLEKIILTSLPSNYPMKRKVPAFNWGTIDNRDYLRSIYYLAQGYYAEGDYKKAKQWFLFLQRCSSRTLGHEKYFLKDIRSSNPDGDLHLIEDKEIAERYELEYS